MKINCLIIDDEPVARKVLEEYIGTLIFSNSQAKQKIPLKPPPYLQHGY